MGSRTWGVKVIKTQKRNFAEDVPTDPLMSTRLRRGDVKTSIQMKSDNIGRFLKPPVHSTTNMDSGIKRTNRSVACEEVLELEGGQNGTLEIPMDLKPLVHTEMQLVLEKIPLLGYLLNSHASPRLIELKSMDSLARNDSVCVSFLNTIGRCGLAS
jgi:hypothetical protein